MHLAELEHTHEYTMSEDTSVRLATLRSGHYPWYVACITGLVAAFNLMDRQLLSILADDIKKQLLLSDAQLGFLYGTAFAVFYSVFGLPFGRVADSGVRKRLMAGGLCVWSLLTALSGFATTYSQLCFARAGVGVGEATASPAAFALLSEYFPERRRAIAISIYTAGFVLGAGLSLPVGAWVSQHWNMQFPHGGAPLGLAGWQAAFLAIGVPGVLLSFWVLTLREPPRRITIGPRVGSVRVFLEELSIMLPPGSLLGVARVPRELRIHLWILGAVLAVTALGCILSGDVLQWTAYGIGLYAVLSWIQRLRRRDGAAYTLIWATPTMLCLILAAGTLAYVTYSYAFWLAPYALRTYGVDKNTVGLAIGIPGALAAAAGVLLGGRLSDAWKRRDPRGRIFVCMLAVILPAPFVWVALDTQTFGTFCLMVWVVNLTNNLWVASIAAAYQDYVLPRMNGTIGAIYVLTNTMLGLALGPYMTGKIATLGASLHTGILALYVIAPLTLLLLLAAARRARLSEDTKVIRAQSFA
jgi:MFS family permease